ncbi:MAG: cell division protein SepF [Chitinophagales bacterium]
MNLVDKFWHWFGVGDIGEDEMYEKLPDERKNDRKANVVSLHAAKTHRVVVCEPTNFDEAKAIADNLKNRRQIILNLENTAPEVSRRIIDFISGTTYAMDGHYQKLGQYIFLFAPSNVEISKDPRLVLRSSYTIGGRSALGSDE